MAGPRLAGSPRRRAGNPAVPARQVPADVSTVIHAAGRIGRRRRLGHHRDPDPRCRRGAGRAENGWRRCPRRTTAGGYARRGAGPGPPPARPGSGSDPGFVPRQLCLQATELGETLLAAYCRTRLLASDDPGPVLQWTTRRASPALILELGCHDSGVNAVAVLPDGRVVSGGGDGRVLVWDPAEPGSRPGRARPPRPRWTRWRCCRTGGWSPAAATAGCWCGTRRSHGPARSSSAATRRGGRRWRCCRTGGWSAAASTAPGRMRRLGPGGPGGRDRPVELGRHDGRGERRWRCCRTGGWSAAARRPGAVWDPAEPRHRPGRARPPRRRGERGGGAAGRAGGQRRRRRPGAGVGPG